MKRLFYHEFRYRKMNAFSQCLENSIFKRFRVEAEVSVSKKKEKK